MSDPGLRPCAGAPDRVLGPPVRHIVELADVGTWVDASPELQQLGEEFGSGATQVARRVAEGHFVAPSGGRHGAVIWA